MAEEPAGQRRRRTDHRRRRRRPQPQLPQPLGLRRRGLVLDRRRARPIAVPEAGIGARDPGDDAAAGPHQGSAFQVNYHSTGQWLLYAEGWQIGTPTADDPIYYALSGNLDQPAIEDFHPGLSADVLYVTNGETTDYAPRERPAPWRGRPSSPRAVRGLRFRVPRPTEELVQAEFRRNLPFARSVAPFGTATRMTRSPCSGSRPSRSTSTSADPYKRGNPGVQLQLRQVLRRPAAGRGPGQAQPRQGDREVPHQRRPGADRAHPRVARRAERTTRPPSTTTSSAARSEAPTSGDSRGGLVPGWRPAQRVVHLRRRLRTRDHRVLVVAAEDYTGASPDQTSGPHYLDYYLDALDANGVAADVYDVDAEDRVAPDQLGVLATTTPSSGTPATTWSPARPARDPGNADRLALDQMLEFRAYLNEGGRVLYTGNAAGEQFTAQRRGPALRPKGSHRVRAAALRASIRGGACSCEVRVTGPTTSFSTTWAATSP